ncbi:uncharacterized protein LOC128727013 [Anopheles nili]|uniref:uncharacterized protein LOC128727013 n=1 Tax=Anopheles nili TaxID=185578 RepID=UPI00237B75F7|nr:uncharacterized protein LOC128727013 [Anopheles nili]
MKLFEASSTLLFVLILGLVWSEQLEEDNDTNDLETAESAFHIDPKTVIFTGLAGIGALVVKGIGLGVGAGKLFLLAKHAGNSHNSGWDSSSSSYSSHPSYPSYKSYSSSYSSSSSSESKPSSYTGSLKVSGSLTPVSSQSSSDSAGSSTSAPAKTSLSLDDVDDPLPEN